MMRANRRLGLILATTLLLLYALAIAGVLVLN